MPTPSNVKQGPLRPFWEFLQNRGAKEELLLEVWVLARRDTRESAFMSVKRGDLSRKGLLAIWDGLKQPALRG